MDEIRNHAQTGNNFRPLSASQLTVDWVNETVRAAVAAEREFWQGVMMELIAEDDERFKGLEQRLGDIEKKSSFQEQFRELEVRLDGRQAARDESKRGPAGDKGDKGDKGEPGLPGARGELGKPGGKGDHGPQLVAWRVDPGAYAAVGILNDGSETEPLDLSAILRQFLEDLREPR